MHPVPMKLTFNPHTAKYKNWLLLLSICHHLPAFLPVFLSHISCFESSDSKRTKQWFINRIHFTRALLEQRGHFDIAQNQALLPPSTAKSLSVFDNEKKCMIKNVNTVSFLDGVAQRILPDFALHLFHQSRLATPKLSTLQDHFVQAPVSTLNEAKMHLLASSSILAAGPGGKLSIKVLPQDLITHITVIEYKEHA